MVKLTQKEAEEFDALATRAFDSFQRYVDLLISLPLISAYVLQAGVKAGNKSELTIEEKQEFVIEELRKSRNQLLDYYPAAADIMDEAINNLDICST